MRTRSGGGGRRMRGLAVGIVTNITDPDSVGRVKVKFPWLDDTIESNWARVAGWYAGASRGTMFVPEIGDEVMLAFDNGDPNHPYVLGAVWNGKHKVPGPGNTDGKNDHKWFKSRSGHDLEFLDSDGAEKIRLLDYKGENYTVMDTAADTITTESKNGSITISAKKLIQIDCVDLKITTSKDRGLTVGSAHTVTVGANRTVGVSSGSFNETAGNSYTITAATVSTSTSTHSSVAAGAMTVNSGTMKSSVTNWLDMKQSATVTRTVGMQKTESDVFATVAGDGGPSGVLTLTAGPTTMQGDSAVYLKGKVISITGGLINIKGSSILVAKKVDGGKTPLSTWMGGLLMLNPGGITMPAAKMLDMVIGFDIHGPTTPVPPAPPIPLVPMPFCGPIVLSIQPTVLVNFMPAAGSGAIAIGFHPPPLPFMWIPVPFGGILKSAIMALVQAPFMALLELARGQLSALASSSTSPVLKNGFVQGFLGNPPDGGGQGGSDITIGRFFPMFGSPQAFLGFLAQCMPLPVASGQATIASPTVTAADSPMAMAMPMGGNSCSNIPVVPNAGVIGFSNVMTGMSLSQLLGMMAWNAVSAAAQHGLKKGTEAAENAVARKIANSNNPALQNTAQKVNDFTGSNHCMSEGHPVDVASGTVFNSQTDFELHGPTKLSFTRHYNSKGTESLRADAFSFGPGWRHAFEQTLVADADAEGERNLALRDAEGRFLGFAHPLEDGKATFHPLDRLLMHRLDGRTYAVEAIDRTRRVFQFPGGEPGKAAPAGYLPGVGSTARLVAIEYTGGARITFDYEDATGRLLRLNDAHGRVVEFTRDRAGRITEIRLTQSGGRECNIHLASYQYDADGRLIGHTDRNRNVRRFSYDDRARLVKETDRCGYSFHFAYDEADRCIRTHGDDNAYWVELAYEPGGGVTTATDGFGGKTVYKYNPQKLVTEILDAEGGATKREYTESGWLTAITSPAGRRRETEFDDRGRVVSSLDAIDGRKSVEYDHDGRPVRITNEVGKSWIMVWDDAGRLTAESMPGGGTRRYEYDAAGNPTLYVSPDGATRRTRYRADGLAETDVLPDGREVSYAYDALGRVTTLKEEPREGGETLTFVYQRDAEGYITGIDRPEGRLERFEVDAEGRPVKHRIGARAATLRYNGMGKLVEHTDSLGRSTRMAYDAHQRPVALDAPGDRKWRWSRDRLGRVVRMEQPDGESFRYEYDADGLVVGSRSADGRIVRREWDGNGQLSKVTWPNGTHTTYEYDLAGRLLAAESDGERSVKRNYDADGRVAFEQQGDEWIRFTHDTTGRRTRRLTSWGDDSKLSWTPTGALATAKDELGGEHRFFSDALGRRQTWVSPGNVRHELRYDTAHRVIETHLRDALGATLFQRTVTWTPEDAVQSIREVTSRGASSSSTQYDHDAAGRLTGESRDHGAPQHFAHDASDNLLSTPDGDAFEYQPSGRLSADGSGHTYRHDVRGRLVVVEGPRGKRSLWYDHRDRLARVHLENDRLVTYEYDALGRRARTVSEYEGRIDEELLYWDGDQLARRVVRHLAATESRRDEHYLWDLERNTPLLRVVHDSTGSRRQSIHVDQRGAVVALTDDRGGSAWIGQYDAYGRCRESGPEAGEQPMRMAGQLHDASTGFAHHRHRVYDPQSRRFLTLDPIGIAGGLNPYAYPTDPVTMSDPLGLTGCGPSVPRTLGPEEQIHRSMVPKNGAFVPSAADGAPNGTQMGVRTASSNPQFPDMPTTRSASDMVGPGHTVVDGTHPNGLSGSVVPSTPNRPNAVNGTTTAGQLPEGLTAVQDHGDHVSIVPSRPMTQGEYQQKLNSIPWSQ